MGEVIEIEDQQKTAKWFNDEYFIIERPETGEIMRCVYEESNRGRQIRLPGYAYTFSQTELRENGWKIYQKPQSNYYERVREDRKLEF